MKYKHIPSMAHNFGHSFVSFMNYVDGIHIVDEIHRILRQTHEPLHINFLQGVITPEQARSDLLARSVKNYQTGFPNHALSQNVNPACILQFDLSIMPTRTGINVRVNLQDDRGERYQISIAQTAF